MAVKESSEETSVSLHAPHNDIRGSAMFSKYVVGMDGVTDRQSVGAAVDSMLSRLSALRHDNNQKPAELFRKDLISAMKVPDSENLNTDDHLEITDIWRQEWEKGVQVPVNADSLHTAEAVKVEKTGRQPSMCDFRMPKKLLHSCEDENYDSAIHELTGMAQLADQAVRYDLDDLDTAWLSRVNNERPLIGEFAIHEWTMERVLEALETECNENLSNMIKNSEGLGIEYDEDVICDVCRSPDSEETNEMVFCDKCDICIHQACYGIELIPEGSWLCRTCALGIQPKCILCPNSGGAMKSTKSGTKWCHVSCALWIPEVRIGCVERMEPITKISNIPSTRWELICCMCRERAGACIQCSVKSCKTAFHVTCAFNNNLDMKTILGDGQEEIQLKGFCPKHSKGHQSNHDGSGPPSLPTSPRKPYTEEEKNNLRRKRIQQLEEEFYTCVDLETIRGKLSVCDDVLRDIYEYWKLKRRANGNQPLLRARTEEADLLSKQEEDTLITRMKMFIHLRQDLERVRNLCYMVSRREKTRRSLYDMKEEIFNKQEELLLSELVVSSRELPKILALNHATDVYDQPLLLLNLAARFDRSRDPDDTSSDHFAKPRKTKTCDTDSESISDSDTGHRKTVSDRTSPESDSSVRTPKSHSSKSKKLKKRINRTEDSRTIGNDGRKVRVAGQTVLVRGLKRVTRLPSNRAKKEESENSLKIDKMDAKVSRDSLDVSKSKEVPSQWDNDEFESIRRLPSGDVDVPSSCDDSRHLTPPKSTPRHKSRGSSSKKSLSSRSRSPKFKKKSRSGRTDKLKRHRVMLFSDTDSDTSLSSTSVVNGVTGESTERRRSSRVKCTLISPVKLKLTLDDNSNHARSPPVSSSSERACSNSNTISSSISNHRSHNSNISNNNSILGHSINNNNNNESPPDQKLRSSALSPSIGHSRHQQSSHVTMNSVSTVSVADMLKLRKARKLDSCSEDSGGKRSRHTDKSS